MTSRRSTASRLQFVSFGVRVGVELEDPALASSIVERLPAGWRRISSRALDRRYSITSTEAGELRLTRDEITGGDEVCVPLARQGDPAACVFRRCEPPTRTARIQLDTTEQLLDAFERDLHLYVAARSRGCVFVHAGVVRWQRAAIVIPGKSFSGKSTLVAALVQAGATAYSDEYAIFDSSGHVHAFPRPLRIRAEGRRHAHRIRLPHGTVRDPLKAVLLVFSKYEEDALWKPRRISPGTAMLHLLVNTIAVRHDPQRALSVLSRVAGHAAAFESCRGEATHITESLMELCQTSFPTKPEA